MTAAHDTQALADAAFLDWRSRRPHGGATARDELCFRDGFAATLASRLQEKEGQPAQDGYVTAFYELAALMGLHAQAVSPETVWREQMLPTLRATLSAGSQAVQVGDKSAIVQADSVDKGPNLQAVQVPEATQDELVDFAEALERRRCITIAQTVMAEMEGFTNPPYTAGFNQACEEIAHRIEHEEWVFQDPAAPQQPMAGGEVQG